MATFLPCPSCGRHVRTSEHACPFCGAGDERRPLVGRIFSPLPELLPALILGMSLVACDSPRPAEKYGAPPPPAKAQVEETKTTTDDSGAEAGGGNEGKDSGDEAGEMPRPAEKYGGPPMRDEPLDEPAEKPLTADDDPTKPEVDNAPIEESKPDPEPRPKKKYGAPSMRNDKDPKLPL